MLIFNVDGEWNGLDVYVYARIHEIIKGGRCNTLDWRKNLFHPIQCRREKTHHIYTNIKFKTKRISDIQGESIGQTKYAQMIRVTF